MKTVKCAYCKVCHSFDAKCSIQVDDDYVLSVTTEMDCPHPVIKNEKLIASQASC